VACRSRRRATRYSPTSLRTSRTAFSWNDQADTDKKIAMMSPINLAKLEDAKRISQSMGKADGRGLYRRSRGSRDAGSHVSRREVRFDELAWCLRIPSGGTAHHVPYDADATQRRENTSWAKADRYERRECERDKACTGWPGECPGGGCSPKNDRSKDLLICLLGVQLAVGAKE
jgi:hypothetical protein